MLVFSPHEAARMADGVYSLPDDPRVLDTAIGRKNAGIPEGFTVSGSGPFSGTTGLVLRSKSVMGYVATGTGSRQGEALVVTRGTAGGWDALTDVHVGYRAGPGGQLVHTGFDLAHESFRDDVSGFLRRANPTHVHCVGHSLGGALATLNADMISHGRIAGVSLYTFGGPRVGLEGFGSQLTKNVGPSNIYQVHHDADPVAMIPVYPFYHVPRPGRRQTWVYSGAVINPLAHLMTNYIRSAEGRDWAPGGLEVPPPPLGSQVGAWLDASDSGIVAFSKMTLVMIGRAITWILEKAVLATGYVVVQGLQQAGTALDLMAYLLVSGAHASVELAEWIGSLVRKVLKWVGMNVIDPAQTLTKRFILWALQQFYRGVTGMARRAIEAV